MKELRNQTRLVKENCVALKNCKGSSKKAKTVNIARFKEVTKEGKQDYWKETVQGWKSASSNKEETCNCASFKEVNYEIKQDYWKES